MRYGVFYPELTLGADALSAGRKQEIRRFFVELVRQRGFPLHLANLWNALYFSWDLDERGFSSEAIHPARIPCRLMNARDEALPIGGFVRVQTPTKWGDLWAEVVYKEGAHPDVSDDWVDPRLSGAPASIQDEGTGRVAVVRERFVLDLHAFGPSKNALPPQALRRILRRGKWLDQHGHLLMEAVYQPEEAELEDADYYVRYLLRYHREGLLAFCFREDPGDDDLREALLNSFAAVRVLAEECPELDSWRGKYFFDRDQYRRRSADENAVMGEGDLAAVFRGLSHIPSGQRVAYSAIGPRIIEVLGRGGMGQEEEAQVRGPNYATAVCHANAYVRDRLRREAPEGLLDGDLHLRLDDDWQAGGIWRCEQTSGRCSLAQIPATIPLGLGWSDANAEAADVAPIQSQPVLVSMHGFRLALSRRDLSEGRLRIPGQVVSLLLGEEIELRIVHEGERDRQVVRFDRTARALLGIAWPLSFYSGIVLHCNAERGGTVIKVRTKELDAPLTIDGQEVRFETELSLFGRGNARRISEQSRKAAPSLPDLVHRAFRICGRDAGDSGRALTLTEVMELILGPEWAPNESRPIVRALEQMDLERRGTEYIWRVRMSHRTTVSETALLAAYGDRPDRRLRRIVRRHLVPAHLRRLRGKHKKPSQAKVQTYAEARVKHGRYGIWPPELPPGYTWVKAHERGRDEVDRRSHP